VSAKRALIVDDSKSARVVLARMLEKYDLKVDTTESAEDAIEYLKANRPDVIFMDHLMPGMDGFQAVQAIKSNPATATIPIMMYTSQEGELYVGQARALGAVGVMPKQVAPVDVSKVLYQLRLLPDRRDSRPSAFEQVAGIIAPAQAIAGAAVSGAVASGTLAAAGSGATAGTAVAATAGSAPSAANSDSVEATGITKTPPSLPPVPVTAADLRGIVEPMLKEQSAELRRFVVASLDSFAARVSADSREIVKGMPAPVVNVPPPPEVPPPPKPTAWIALAALGCLVALATAAFAWRQHQDVLALADKLAEQERALAGLKPLAPPAAAPAATDEAPRATPAAAVPAAARAAAPAFEPPAPVVVPVPYGEVPLSGTRLDPLRTLLADLESKQFRGRVRVTSYVGDFCLTGNPAEGYSLAPDEMVANRCDLVGNPYDDGLRPAQRQSLAFANLVAGTRQRTQGGIDVVVVNGGRTPVTTAYPSGADANAGQWNAAAAANHRVEYTVEPAPAAP
jgi:CheY-like chemotaxis protein